MATTPSTKPRRRIRFDTHNVEYYPHIVSDKATLDKWKEVPNEGDIVKVPDPLPQWWWKQSADALQRCQREA
eukprot:7199472-Pyramimonas_sp.AAC.1